MTVGAEWVAAVISKNGCDGIAQPGPALFIVHPLTGPWCVVCEDLLHVSPVYRRPPKSPVWCMMALSAASTMIGSMSNWLDSWTMSDLTSS